MKNTCEIEYEYLGFTIYGMKNLHRQIGSGISGKVYEKYKDIIDNYLVEIPESRGTIRFRGILLNDDNRDTVYFEIKKEDIINSKLIIANALINLMKEEYIHPESLVLYVDVHCNIKFMSRIEFVKYLKDRYEILLWN